MLYKPLSCTIACTVFCLMKFCLPHICSGLRVDSSVPKLAMKHLSIFLSKLLQIVTVIKEAPFSCYFLASLTGHFSNLGPKMGFGFSRGSLLGHNLFTHHGFFFFFFFCIIFTSSLLQANVSIISTPFSGPYHKGLD